METQAEYNDEIEIDLGEIVHLLVSRLGVIILTGIILGLVAIMGTMVFITPKYKSTTKIVILNKQDDSMLTSSDIQSSTYLTEDYAELIKSRTVIEGVIAELDLDITYEELLGKLSIETLTDTRIISITVEDEDPYMACDIANSVRDVASAHIQDVMDIQAVNVVENANIPDEKSSPSLTRNGIIGGLIGVLLAIVIVIIVYLANDSIQTAEDVEKYLGLSVLGTIPLTAESKRTKKKKKSRKRFKK